jgi:hypothetical protein
MHQAHCYQTPWDLFSIAAPTVAWLCARYSVPPPHFCYELDGAPEVRGVCSGGLARHGMGPAPVKTWLPPQGALLQFSVSWPWNGPGLRKKHRPTARVNSLPAAWGYTEDVFSCRYTLPTLSVQGAGRLSKSVVATAMFWLAPAKVGCGVASWLMVAAMAQAQARALVNSMVVTHSIPSVALHRCSSVIGASRSACSSWC